MSAATTALTIWVDAQLPPSLARWLRTEYGVAARHVVEEGLVNAEDSHIFACARDSGIDAVTTKDEDFVRLVERHGPPPRIVWVTVGNLRNVELRRVVLDGWPSVEVLLRGSEPLVELRRRL